MVPLLHYQMQVDFLKRYSKVCTKNLASRVKIAQLRKDDKAAVELYKTTIAKMLKDAKINLVIQNVPIYGVRSDDKVVEFVDAKSIHETMAQFGKVKNAVVFNRDAYIWFKSNDDAQATQKLLNGMEMNNNIIKTVYVA
jgi:RNA recognition motif-containing protein